MRNDKAQLLTRKRDLFEALRVLEQDHQDGLVGADAYVATRRRYEHEAAEILARLDALLSAEDTPTPRRGGPSRRDSRHGLRRGWLLLAFAGTFCVAGALVFLVGAVHQRVPGEVISGSIGQGGPTTSGQSSPNLQAAERAVYRHPRSYDALLNLGTAYLQSGRVMEADLSYQAAMRADPARADAPTFHAMLLGAVKRYRQALLILGKVERDHPAYARAWLMDGVLSSHIKSAKERAVGAWLRFLLLEPQSDLAPKVRRWIAQLEGRK